ncbi:MAG TPA: ABC transporter substrate-binding protein [Edaphocola sp.]|nr:ABC transporter substrate-binding protein [Edaphocola sp.]
MTIQKFGIKLIGLLLLPLIAFQSCNNSKSQETTATEKEMKAERIISLNGGLSEIVYALGKGKSLVGRDVTSTYPDYVKDSVKDLGHIRSLSTEAILSLQPTMILALKGEINEKLSTDLKNSGIAFHTFEPSLSEENTKKLIDEIGTLVGNTNTQSLKDKIDQDKSDLKAFTKKPKVLFIYARGAGNLMVAGAGTPMQAVMEMAGAENAIQGIQDFKPLTEESLLNANPDVVLMFDMSLKSLGGKEAIFNTIPALSKTKAGINKALIVMDSGLLSEMGTRLGEAIKTLNQLLIPYAQ